MEWLSNSPVFRTGERGGGVPTVRVEWSWIPLSTQQEDRNGASVAFCGRSEPIGSHDPVGFLLVYKKSDLHKLFTYLDDFVNRAQVPDYTEVISG